MISTLRRKERQSFAELKRPAAGSLSSVVLDLPPLSKTHMVKADLVSGYFGPPTKNMKCVWHIIAMLLATLLVGCGTTPQARIVRLKIAHEPSCWEYSLNGSNRVVVSSESLTNEIFRLHLHHGDIVLFGMIPLRSLDPAMDWNWFADYCNSNQVALYHYTDPGTGDIFSIPVYHWVAPFNFPRTLARASFFRESQYLGRKMTGYKNMVKSIGRTCPPRMLILGSAYNLDTNYGPGEEPYEDEENALDVVLNKNHIAPIYLLPDFGF